MSLTPSRIALMCEFISSPFVSFWPFPIYNCSITAHFSVLIYRRTRAGQNDKSWIISSDLLSPRTDWPPRGPAIRAHGAAGHVLLLSVRAGLRGSSEGPPGSLARCARKRVSPGCRLSGADLMPEPAELQVHLIVIWPEIAMMCL